MRNLSHDSLPASGDCQPFLVLWLVDMRCSYLPLPSRGLLLCLFPLLFSYKDLSLDLGSALIQDGLISRSLILSANTLVPSKVVFSGSR